ncbi:THAP domain-containing protein 9 [Plakobranchus ocellatus]|uniref:THAP domain-containing protein 9 n=1 Tax=Plakobranchus ocellatus TaxID=259542 RepID=A0AAV3Z2C7_9GAST|nr:THAP domain-containing protein 9 [Plakobranchus ocellatus]
MERNKNTHCKWCSAYGCSNSKNKRPELSFLRFPSNSDRCKKWVVNTRRADLLSTPVEVLKLPIRLASKLSKRHIELPNFAKLKVSLAVQVLSHTVAAGISTMVSFKALPPDATATAQFVEKFDQLFNCFNSRRFN